MKLLPARAPYLAMACVVVAAAILLSFLWGTAFTCADDLFTATAWQRWTGGAPGLSLVEAGALRPTGWPAIFRASRVMAAEQGRFYQVFAYTLAQTPYRFHSIPVVNLFRIGCMVFVFFSFALLLKGLLSDLRLALFFVLLSIALLQTGYSYNPFHALPLWFNLAAGLLFLALFFYNEGRLRKSRALDAAAVVMYCGALLLYESFLCYIVLFPVLSCLRSRENSWRSRLWRALLDSSWIIAITAVYLGCYFAFSAAHPPTYAGRFLSPAPPAAILTTIFRFSVSGLNFQPLFHPDLQWNLKAAVMAVIVFPFSFAALRRYSPALSGRRLAALAGCGVTGMCAPNILYGFSERYRHWAISYGDFYLGSFYSAFAEAVVVGTLGLLAVKLAGLLRMKTAGALGIAAVFALAGYANVGEGDRLFAIHRENREYWRLVDALLSDSESGLTGPSAVIAAPSLLHLPNLDTAVYDYWSFYFSGKLHFPVRVVGSPAELSLLPENVRLRSPVFGLAAEYRPDLKAGFAAMGAIDAGAWRNDPAHLLTARAAVTVVGGGGNLFLAFPAAGAGGRIYRRPATEHAVIEGAGPVDLSALILER